MRHSRQRFCGLSGCVSALALLLSCAACAAPAQPTYFSISEQDISTALLEFAQQAEISILIPSGVFAGIKSNQLEGRYDIREALQILLEDTAIEASFLDETKQVVVKLNRDDNNNARGENEMLQNSKTRRGLLASAVAAVIAGGGSPAVTAQDAGQQGAAQGALEEIAVTGSRIQRPGMTSPVPVTAVTANELSNIAPGNLSQGLAQVPQFLNNATAQNRGTFLGSAGQAFLNIRGMGSQRTLVLLNGRRVAPSDRQSAVDINLFPDAMISRIDVVTGGASAAYGADALAGVANFVLNTQYEGFEVNTQVGMTEYSDGKTWEVSMAGGFALGDSTHVIASLEGFHNDDIRGKVSGLDDRDWFERWGWVNNPAYRAGNPATYPARLTLPQVHSANFTPGGKINQPGFAFNNHTFIEDGTQTRLFVPGAITGGGATTGGPEYAVANLGQRENLMSEVSRLNLFVNVEHRLSDATTLNFQAIAGQNEAYNHKINGGLGPAMMGIWGGTIYRDNAFLPENIRQAMVNQNLASFRMEKGGALPGRNNFQDDHTDGTEVQQHMFMAGVEHEFDNGWSLNAYYQYGKSHKHMLLDNLLRVDRWFLAQDAVRDPASGEIVCRVKLFNPSPQQLADSVAGVLVPSPQGPVPISSPVGLDNTIQDCQPLNIFGWGNVSQAARDYVVSDKWADSYVIQDFAEAVFSGQLFDDLIAGPVDASFGATYRKQDLDQTAFPREIDALGPPLNRPALGIQGIPGGYTGGSPNLHAFSNLTTFGGKFDVWEVFGETLVPLYQDEVRSVNLSLAARHSDYSLAGGVLTWKAGLDFQVTEALRLRTTLSRDVREATFAERFDKAGGGTNVNDPVFGGQPFGITTASGGNPNVKPEEADTYVVGFVYQPGWLPGLDISADYYDIDLQGAIGSLGFQRVVDDCAAGNSQLCAQITRDPVTNQITRVEDFFTNIDAAAARGVDLETAYRTEIDLFSNHSESLTIRVLASYLAENSNTPSGGRRTDFAGSGLLPEWTTTSTLNYSVGPWRLFLSHRFIDKTKFNVNWVEGVDVDDNYLNSVRWMNMRLGYEHEMTNGSTWEAFLNVQNLLGDDPPPNPGTVGRGLPGGANAMHQILALGRNYTLGLQMRF